MGTLIHPASFVDPAARLGAGVEVGPGTIVGPDVVVGDHTRIGANALLTGWTQLGSDCRIHHGAVLGSPPQDLKFKGGRTELVIGDRTEIREYATANLATQPEGATRIGSDCLIMAYAHVAHDCQIQDHVIVANAVQFAGFVTVEEWAIVGGGTVVHQFARIGCHAIIGGGSRVSQDVLPYVMTAGSPPRNAGINRIGLERRGFTKESRDGLEQAYRTLLRDGLTVAAAVARIRATLGGLADVERFAHFAETSVRGITR